MAATPSPVVLTRPPSTSTATKYRNTTTATCYLARLGTALPCSVANMVAVAGSSGRRGLLNEVRRPMIIRSRHRRKPLAHGRIRRQNGDAKAHRVGDPGLPGSLLVTVVSRPS